MARPFFATLESFSSPLQTKARIPDGTGIVVGSYHCVWDNKASLTAAGRRAGHTALLRINQSCSVPPVLHLSFGPMPVA